MGDFRITIEGVGNHGCGRGSKDGEVVERCGQDGCVECEAIKLVEKLGLKADQDMGGASTVRATVEHWPKHNVDGTRRRGNSGVGPVDDLLRGTRRGSFQVTGPHGCLTGEGLEKKSHEKKEDAP